tara:strand:- start:1222 stop:1962 length:741 start_codon:yes stop_codon:yes gene_type:complete
MNNLLYTNEFIQPSVENLLDFTKIDMWVFSYGGCGTNYLRKALYLWNKRLRKTIGTIHTKRPDCNFRTFKLATLYLKQDLLLKQSTHIFTPPAINQEFIAFYIFGDPLLTLQSLFKHKRAQVVNILAGKQLYTKQNMDIKEYIRNGRDELRLIEHFNNWYNATTSYKILFINYDKLKNNFDEIEKLINDNCPITVRNIVKKNIQERTSCIEDYTSEEIETLQAVYGDFRKKLADLPHSWIKEPSVP